MTAVEFIISLKDNISAGIEKIAKEFSNVKKNSDILGSSIGTLKAKGENLRIAPDASTSMAEIRKLNGEINKTEKEITKLQNAGQGGGIFKKLFSGAGNILGAVGIGFGVFQLVSGLEKGVEKAHMLHEAEAQLKNTMQNMGTYSKESFERAVEGSKEMAKGINYSTAEVVGLQSQLRMVGGIGENEMKRMVTASADLSTKMGMGLEEAGDLLAKAVNSPEKMARLGQRIKIDPAMVAHLQGLAKNGHEAQARLELLNIIQQKVGGAAKAAFDADPMAQWKKTTGVLLMALGNVAIVLQQVLGPVLNIVGIVIGWIAKSITWLGEEAKKGSTWIKVLAGVVGGLTAVLGISYLWLQRNVIWQSIKAGWDVICTGTTTAFAGAMSFLNAVFLASPIGWFVIAIGLLVGLVYEAIKHFSTWGATIMMLLGPIGWIVNMIMALKNNWDSIVEAFTGGGILAGLKRIGIVLLDTILYPVQQLLTMLSKIPGLSDLAGSGARKLAEIRAGFNLVTPKEIKEKKAENKENHSRTEKVNNASTTDDVASGGSRNTSIYININKEMIGEIKFIGGLKENADNMKKQLTEVLLEVLYAAQSAS